MPLRADCFQQRHLGTVLADTVGAGETAVPTQVLAGLGGVGKTQLAAEFAEDQWAVGELDLLVWITAGRREAIVSGYATAASKIGLITSGEDEDFASQRFLEWLGETDRRWLIVLDDLQEPGQVHRLWPPPRATGRVVVTTRRRDAALSGRGRRMLEVGLFHPQEALAYVQAKLADQPALAEGAEALAADVGYLPLALAQAAAYLADRQITCTDYRHRLADQRRRLDQLVPESGSLPDDQHSTVAATWSLSVELADQLAPVGLARPLLELAAVLDPNGIPADIFTTSAMQNYLATRHLRSEPVNADEVWDALRGLHRLSLATVDTANPHRSVRVHALVQRATREQHHPDHRPADTAHAAADALLQTWPRTERDTNHVQTLRANTDHLHTHTGTHLWNPDTHPVLFHSGDSRGEAGHSADATTYFHHLHTQATQILGPDHPDTLFTRSRLARWRGEAGDAAGAVAAFEELLPDLLRVLGPDHPHTLSTRSHLARCQDKVEHAAGAPAFKKLLDDQIRVLGPDHPDTLSTRHNLAGLRGDAGDADGAVAAFEELLTDLVRVLGPDHPHTLATRHNLARWRGAGDAAGAVAAFEELLTDLVRVLGPDHPDTLTTRHNLADLRGDAGDADGAVAAFEELLTD
ncbi:tetratricopeptide repeat protein, partial [Saccharopolyspora sp. HNM0986]|nr:tetratricopeptide repeat protein [Saccharopolyspora sp. HNM0986]